MSDEDAFWHEMAESTSPQRLGHEPDERVLDFILDGQLLPPSAASGVHVLTGKLAELAAPGGAGTVAGEAAAMNEFRRRFSPASTLALPLPDEAEPAAARQRTRWWRGLSRARLAGAAAVVAVVLGGGGVAAYAGALPAPVQELAHNLIGAPAATHSHPGHGHSGHAGQSPNPGHHKASAPGQQKGRGHGVAHGKASGHGKRHHRAHPANAGKRSGKKKRTRHSRAHSPAPTHSPTPKL